MQGRASHGDRGSHGYCVLVEAVVEEDILHKFYGHPQCKEITTSSSNFRTVLRCGVAEPRASPKFAGS